MTTNYARNQGIVLLEGIVKAYGPIFSIKQAYEVAFKLPLSRQEVGNVLSLMVKGGWIKRLKRGVYATQSPLFEENLHPFALAQALVESMAISHWSALAYHGFTTQIPPMVQASTPTRVVTPEMRTGRAYAPRGRSVWKVLDVEVEFIHVAKDKFWGFIQKWVSDWHRVKITDPERTILDLVVRSDLYEGITMALETLSSHKEEIDISKLVEYAIRYGMGSAIKRLGWILENTGAPSKILEPLQSYDVQNYYPLDPQRGDEGEPITRWQLIYNLPGGKSV